MRLLSTLLLGAFLLCLHAADASAKIVLALPPEMPTNLGTRDAKDLTSDREVLLEQYSKTQSMIDRQAELCGSVEEGSANASQCATEAIAIRGAVKEYRASLNDFKVGIANAQTAYSIISGMTSLASRLGWTSDEQLRLKVALNTLGSDGTAKKSMVQIEHTWADILARSADSDVAKLAAKGEGPGLPGAGEQLSHSDCAIFALANAAGIPYGVVAARATKLISEGDWRKPEDRANPQRVIEDSGLNGGEVVMLAESFGRARVVESSHFATALRSGAPVLVKVMPKGGGAHEVVLTKSFQNGRETWFEMMDSTRGAMRRLYLSKKELDSILLENGVAFRPDDKSTVKLFR